MYTQGFRPEENLLLSCILRKGKLRQERSYGI